MSAQRKWSAEIIVSAIKARHENGEPLNSNYIQKNCSPLYQAACKHLGSWKAAVEAAGIPYDSVKVKVPNREVVWTKDIIVRRIKARHENGEPLNSNHVQQNERRLYAATVKYFGSWKAAVEAAGILYDSVYTGVKPYWSKELVIAEIKKRSAQGKSISHGLVTEENNSLVHAAKRFFPGPYSWRKARVAAGFSQIDEPSFKKWNKKIVIRIIRKLREKGVSLNVGAMREGNLSKLYSAGCKYFGSWKAAVEAAGVPYKKVRKVRSWTKRKIIKEIRKLLKQGIRLNLKNVQKIDAGLLGAAISRFGSWGAAVEAAGISYRSHCKVWSTKAWLQRMTHEEYRQTLGSARSHSKTFKERRKK
tara:strand:+ start:12856 stop:13938 length:1083 start_codon:yes stop_codon:yes gene_type:complete